MFKENSIFIDKIKTLYVSITVVFMILLVIITGVFGNYSKKQLYKEVSNHMEFNRESIDKKINRYIKSYAQNNIDFYLRPSSFSLFYEVLDQEPKDLHQIRISIIDSLRKEENIADFILYRTFDNAVVSAVKSGYTIEDLTAQFDDIKSIINTGELSEAKFHITTDNSIIYVYPVINPNMWYKETTYQGFTTLYLKDQTSFFRTNVNEHFPNGTFIIANNDKILLAEGNNILSDEVITEFLSNNGNKGLVHQKFHNQDYTFYLTHSTEHNLKYLYYQPKTNYITNLREYGNNFGYYIIIQALVIVLYGITLTFIRKIQRLCIEHLNLANDYANELINSNRASGVDLIIEKYLKIKASYKYYSIIIIEPDIAYMAGLTEKQKVYLMEEFKELAKKRFSSLQLPSIVSLQNKGCISCIINYDEGTKLKQLADYLREDIENYHKCKFNIFYSDSYTDVSHTSLAFTRLIELMKYSFIYKYSNIFTLEELEEMEKNPKIVDTKVFETAQSYLADLNFENFIEYLTTTLGTIQANRYSYNHTIDYFNMIFYAVKNLFIEKSIDYQLMNDPFTKQLSRFYNLEESISFIQNTLHTYKESIMSNQTPTNRKYMEGIILHIDNNIEDVTLSLVAEKFNMTSSHLSRIFKESIGINFSEYVSEKKLAKAAWLLKSNTDLTIVDIANQLGYNTPSYFSSKFKERFGVTPGVYKKEYLLNQ